MSIELEPKNLVAVAHPHTGIRLVPAPVGSRSGGWAGLVMWTKRPFLWWIASAEGPERLTVSPTSSLNSVMGNCHQMTGGSCYFYWAQLCNIKVLLVITDSYCHTYWLSIICCWRLLFWLIFGKRSTCCMRAVRDPRKRQLVPFWILDLEMRSCNTCKPPKLATSSSF